MFKNQYKAAVTGILILFFFGYGCTKIDSTNLGQSLIPVVDNIHTFDTTYNVIANNYDDASMCDSVYREDLHALGIIANDPLFGKTTANIYLELKPQTYPFTFPAADAGKLSVDSAVIVLSYSHSYGDSNALQKVQVYPLLDNFKVDTTYTTCNIFNFDNAVLLGEKFYYPRELNDSVHAYGENSASQIRIPIDKSLIEKFIADSATIFKTDSSFKSFFKGFALVSAQATGGQALNYFDLTGTDTRLAIYLTSSVAGIKDTSVVSFPLTDYSGEANSIIRERGTSEITSHLSRPPAGDSLIYIQTSPGSYAQLTIPGLTGLSNRVIHRAELIVEQVYSPSTFDDILNAPTNMYLDIKDTSGSTTTYKPIPCDFTSTELSTNFSNLGGSAHAIPGAGHTVYQYVFNIPRYVQSIVTQQSNNAVLRLSAPYHITNNTVYYDRCGQGIGAFDLLRNDVASGRIKLNGTNNTSTHIRLHVVYSTLQ